MASEEWGVEDMGCEVGDVDASPTSFARTTWRAPLEEGIAAAAEISAGQRTGTSEITDVGGRNRVRGFDAAPSSNRPNHLVPTSLPVEAEDGHWTWKFPSPLCLLFVAVGVLGKVGRQQCVLRCGAVGGGRGWAAGGALGVKIMSCL
jgi:hypothetical protein